MLLGVLSPLLVILLGQAPTPSSADWQWLDQNRAGALEAAMPMQDSDFALVTYRSYRDLYHEIEEHYFRIRYASPDRLEATVVTPIGASIQEQILDLHMSNRQASLEALLPQVSLQRRMLDAEHCPAIRSRMDALSKTALSLPDMNPFTLHPFVHHISIRSGLAEIDAKLYDDDNPLVKWAKDTVTALMACDSGK
jgi:hypothetical protein